MSYSSWEPAPYRNPATSAATVGTPRWAAVAGMVCLLAWPLGAQPAGTVAGRVIDAATQRPLAGAQVFVTGTQRGAQSDAAGRFTITGIAAAGGEVTLQARLIGYRAATAAARVGDANVRIAMEQTAVSLDQVVVTGTPGEERVRSLGNAVGKVAATEVLQIAPPPNMQALLATDVPGVQVQLSRGEIGAGANIRIRGASSMSLTSEPLLYIDGVRVNNNFADQGGGITGVGVDARTPPSRINDLNPEDIESIEIIKGPAAATLYGTEASNGVIQVITKRGRGGRPAFNLVVQQGANWLPDPESLFGDTYFRNAAGEVEAFNVLRRDREVGFSTSVYGGTCPAPYRQDGERCKGEVFRTGVPRSYLGSVSGGSENLRYYFSGGWAREEGPVAYNWQNKLNGRGNMSWSPSEKITVDFGVGGVRSALRTASAQQPITTSIIWSQPSTREGPFRGYIGYVPERYHDDIAGYQDVDRTTYSVTANHRPLRWLTHRLVVGGDFTNTVSSELFKRINVGVGSSQPLGSKTVQSQTASFVSGDYAATVTFNPLRGLRSATSGGVQYYQRQSDYLYGQGTVFPISQLETVTAGATRTAREDFAENKTVGGYVQEQLSWKDRLFLTAAVRGDDNSAFGKNYDFVMYPKVSVSWVVSEEPFLARRNLLNTLKLRGAWGKAGQQPDIFAALRTYEPQVGIGAQPALTTGNLGNPDLKPEVGEELELGFDAGFLNERVGLEFTMFDKRTKDAIVSLPATPSLGFPGTQFRNIGEIRNRGFELGLRAQAYRGRNVGVDLSLAGSRIDNEVASIGGGVPLSINASQFHVPGYSLGSIFRQRVVSSEVVVRNGVNVATNVMCEGGERIPGSNLSRGGGAPVPCAQAPAVYWGSVLPTWNGSGSATLTLFRNLQLYGLVEAVGGYHWINNDVGAAHVFFNVSRAIVERTDPVLLGYLALNESIAPGIMAGDFARLRRVSATYTLPVPLAQRVRAQRATVTLSADNLGVLWQKQKGTFGHDAVDPEARNSASSATDPGGLAALNQEGWPQLRRFLATVRVTF